MSGWRLVVRTLYALDRPAANADLQQLLYLDFISVSAMLQRTGRMGLIEPNHEAHKASTLWELTPLGRAYAEGRITQAETRPGGRRWVATWLSALPTGIRLEPAPNAVG